MNFVDYILAAEINFELCLKIMRAKSKDYAKDSNPFENFDACTQFGVSREKGILIRVSDKISRIGNLLEKTPDVKDESIHDTIRDAINYLNVISISILEKEKVNDRSEKEDNKKNSSYKNTSTSEYRIISKSDC